MAYNFSQLDDSAFEEPTDKLIRPISIVKLESEDENALVNSHVQPRPYSTGPYQDAPNEDEGSLMHQSIMAQATDLKEFQEFRGYLYGGIDSGESTPEDSDVEDEADDEAGDERFYQSAADSSTPELIVMHVTHCNNASI